MVCGMNLYNLVKETCENYGIDGDISKTVNMLRSAGYAPEISSDEVTSAVDFVLQNHGKGSPLSEYSRLKGDSFGSSKMLCPIDKSNSMETVLLVQDRKALYCKSCNVTLPMKA